MRNCVRERAAVRKYLQRQVNPNFAYVALTGGPWFDLSRLSYLRQSLQLAMLETKGNAGTRAGILGAMPIFCDCGGEPACWTRISVITFVALSMLREANGFLNRRILLCGVRSLTQDASLAALEASFHFDRDNIKEVAMTAFDSGY